MNLLRKTKKLTRNRDTGEPARKVSAYSYHNSRNDLEDNVGRDTSRSGGSLLKGSFWLNRFGFIILLIVCAVCLYSILDLSPDPNIVVLGGSSNSVLYKLYKPRLLSASTKLFKGSLLNHNKVTVNSNEIAKALTAEFPEFSSISVALPVFNQQPTIYVVPGSPSVILQNGQGQYLLNQNGVAMLYGNTLSSFNYLNLPILNDQSGLHVALGQPAITSQDIAFIQTVASQLGARSDKISSFTLPQASNEVDVRLVGTAYYIKFNLQDNDARLQAGNFLATQHYLASQSITPSQYIDVRTDGRAYYQ